MAAPTQVGSRPSVVARLCKTCHDLGQCDAGDGLAGCMPASLSELLTDSASSEPTDRDRCCGYSQRTWIPTPPSPSRR
eukprot:CAMPEP_0182919628 /NCGR_PEP_ID=MMETSP0105_2-20130417/2870_1 /TAXON_ID=81532 ORGANISM="Acanthoeca-like sp., Strain 10tr" /NCGR_SAMPLE_ID=MMETSP0105_2 /ASSEMBLY_ACC=CAM_ASM_000205 /LENGTH=77 /DNA_ID=CAMNT_0025056857 /DNA_START=244 /DNA_END=473 /DNA_ORIENTATION=-